MAEENDVNNNEHEQEVGGNDEVDSNVGQEMDNEPTQEDRLGELNDKYMRLHAEFDNYRKRTNKEKIDIISYAGEGILKDLLPVMDDFERAIENNKTAQDLASVKEGFNLIFNKFKNVLDSKGVKPMSSVGETFDAELHEAIANVPAPGKKQVGKVMEDVEKGYYLNDKVIRFAKVVVGQ